jgi:hypothetical protein
MSTIKDLIKSSPVHQRRMRLRTFPLEDGRLVVEGWLKDDRLIEGYHWNGQKRPAGVIHHLCVRLLVGGWPVTIMDAEAEMPQIPHHLCRTTQESVKKLKGTTIVSGYSEKVRHMLGGVKGCNHLTHLVVVMGTAALHGYWTHRSRKKQPLPGSLEEFQGLSSLVNSCKLWEEDGPIIQEIKSIVENQE